MNTANKINITASKGAHKGAAPKADYLRDFLNLYWLRPESALLCSLLAKNIEVRESVADNIDLSCGDGLFAFTLLGGKLSADFNLYASSRVESSVVGKKDIYDNFDEAYRPNVIVEPRTNMRSGLDLNRNMLARAELLGIYREHILSRAEEYALQGSENDKDAYSSASIFSSIYMYGNTAQLLQAVNQLLRKSGQLIVNVKTPVFREFYEGLEANYPPAFANYIERNMRGILSNLQELHSWEQHFQAAGFSIVSKRTTMSASMVPLWTIGLRSLTPLLIKLVGYVPRASLVDIKSEFVETFYSVMSELCDCGDQAESDEDAASVVYVLEKE